MIQPGDLATSIKGALEAARAERVTLVEPEFGFPRLEVVMDPDPGLPLELWFEDGEPQIFRLEARVLTGLVEDGGPDSHVSLELVLRVLNQLNRLEATPWKFWIRGMRVEFEGMMSSESTGEVWATWSLPAELLSVDDLPGVCRRFSEGVARLDVPGLI